MGVAAKRSRTKNTPDNDPIVAHIQGYIAAQSRKPPAPCSHAGGPLREAWLRGYEAGIKAMAEWGEARAT